VTRTLRTLRTLSPICKLSRTYARVCVCRKVSEVSEPSGKAKRQLAERFPSATTGPPEAPRATRGGRVGGWWLLPHDTARKSQTFFKLVKMGNDNGHGGRREGAGRKRVRDRLHLDELLAGGQITRREFHDHVHLVPAVEL